MVFDEMQGDKNVRRLLKQMDRLDRRNNRRHLVRTTAARATKVGFAGLLTVGLVAVFLWRLQGDPDVQYVGWTAADHGDPGPLVTTSTGGSYQFLSTQSDGDAPVTYDPCETIRIRVNDRTGPGNADQILRSALSAVSSATGLQFDVEGTTDDGPVPSGTDPRDDGGWRPVTIVWSDPQESPDLEGNVAGTGGSAIAEKGGHRWYVTGQVILDGPDLAAGGTQVSTAVLMHELGHLLGLDHVDAPGELMQPTTAQIGFGPGDLAGLEALGQGECR